jgi:hypothetical protein
MVIINEEFRLMSKTTAASGAGLSKIRATLAIYPLCFVANVNSLSCVLKFLCNLSFAALPAYSLKWRKHHVSWIT